jgi:molybdopterin converting factor small subunit
MNQVTIELWLWLGHELKSDFECPSEMRSIKVEDVEDGTTIRKLLSDLAGRYPPIAKRVFDIEIQNLYPDVVMNYNDRVITPHEVYDRILKDGDRITLLPLAGGG